MSKPVIIEREAESEIDRAHAWYEEQRSGLGDDFLLCIEAALAQIADRPGAFPTVRKRTRRVLLKRFPYSILFVELSEAIAVIGCFHTSRNPRLSNRRSR